MPYLWGGNKSAWDFGNPKNWVVNKSLEQNLRELSVGTQIMATVIPEAVWGPYKMASVIAPAATEAAAGGTSAASGLGATGAAVGAASLSPLATTVLDVGTGIFLLEWLKKNWWIPALLLGGYIALKMVEKK